MIFAAVAALGLVGAMATTASATCYYGCSSEQGSYWESGAQGGATNIGSTVGDLGAVGSITTKSFQAGGEATEHGANAWSSGQVTTDGFAAAMSLGAGPQTAGTLEEGSVGTSGGALTGRFMSWGN